MRLLYESEKGERKPKILFTYRVDSLTNSLIMTNRRPEKYDYVKVITKKGNKCIFVVWNEDSSALFEREVYLGYIEEW